MKIRPAASVALFAAILSSTTYAQEPKILRSQLKDQTSVALTVYSNGRSMVRERRKVKMEKGRFALEIRDVSSRMLSETAQLRNVSAPTDLVVLEQNLEFDLLSPTKLLEKFLGRNISVVRTHPTNGSDTSETAEVLSTQNGVVLKVKDRIETGLPGRLVFPEVPKNLRAEPTLSLLVESRNNGEQDLELNYLSEGLTWKADYIADLNDNDDGLDLTGFVTLTNQSGTSFPNAKLQLMAGNVQIVQARNNPRLRSMAYSTEAVADSPASAVPQMQGESFFEYNLYTLPRQTTILSNQTKQLTLLQVPKVVARKEILFDGSSNYYIADEVNDLVDDPGEGGAADDVELGKRLSGGVFIAFDNNKNSRLGMPLPAGIVRVYKSDKESHSQFIGEDRIAHVPENEKVRIRVGSSFDVTARKKQLSLKSLPSVKAYRSEIRVIEFTNRITFSNAKSVEQQVVYRETLPGVSKILKSTLEHRVLNKNTSEWRTTVPAKGKRVLEYTVRSELY